MLKYDLLPKQLILEGTLIPPDFFTPDYVSQEDVLRVHTTEYYEDFLKLRLDKKALRKIGFPLSQQLIDREQIITQGTIDGAIHAVTNNSIALNIAGGTHHAYSDHGEAFCLLNDQAIAAKHLQYHNLASQILIIDLDVHQGNGTAAIFQGDDTVFTFSMHGASNYPFKKEKSDLDIGLPNDTNDEAYLSILKQRLPQLLEMVKPDFVFYLCGVDVVATDKLGKLGMTIAGCKERDRFVLQILHDANFPIQCSMGGGYSPGIKTIIECHANTFRVALDIFG